MIEKEVQEKVCVYARSQGWLAFKWASVSFYGSKGVPDFLFFKDGKLLIVEFKASGKKPTRIQENVHAALKEHGFVVHVISSLEEGKVIFDEQH